jgi:hypothetical protein
LAQNPDIGTDLAISERKRANKHDNECRNYCAATEKDFGGG